MRRVTVLSLLVVVVAASGARGVILLVLKDPADDVALVTAVSGQRPVKQLGSEIDALQKVLAGQKKNQIEKLLGRPGPYEAKDYAMPVAQPRMWTMSGIRYGNEAMNKDHTAFYPIGEYAGIEVWYGIDGETPRFALLYFKVDDAFPKLKKVEDKEPPAKQPPAPLKKNTIDRQHWDKIRFGMSKEDVAEVLSVPPGDYVPGVEYFSRAYGRMDTGGGRVREAHEWRGEKGRVTAEFDERGVLVTSEFFDPGRDPATNIAERLKWDRAKFERVKKYVDERLAAK